MLPIRELLVVCALSAVLPTPAQQGWGTQTSDAGGLRSPTALPAVVVPIHTAAAEGDLTYGLWGAGRSYKASFDGGMTFVPYLGRSYPHNQPLGWTTGSARIGALELVTAAAGEPQVDGDGRGCRFAHGGIDEVYRLLPGSLHQTFVIARRPQRIDGDLVVRGTLTTAPVAPPREARHGDMGSRFRLCVEPPGRQRGALPGRLVAMPDASELVLLHQARTPTEAQLLASRLQAAGVRAFVEGATPTDEFSMSRQLMNTGGVKILVPESQLEMAKAALDVEPVDDRALEQAALADGEEWQPRRPSPPLPLGWILVALIVGVVATAGIAFWLDGRSA